MTDYTSKCSAALSLGYVSNWCHFMLSDHGCPLVRKGIFALLLISHFSPPRTPRPPTLHYQENKPLKSFLKNRKRSNHLSLEAHGHGTHSACFRVETNSELDSLGSVAPPFPLFFDLFAFKHSLDLPKPKQSRVFHTHTPQISPKHLNLALPRSKQVS